MNGFVYVMSNESFKDGLLKIGISSSDPSAFRQDQLYTTGVPQPFKVEYYALVPDFEDVERAVHRRLKDYRPNKNREFFSCSCEQAILTIRELANVKYEEVFYKTPREIDAERIRLEAEERKRQELKKQDVARLSTEQEKHTPPGKPSKSLRDEVTQATKEVGLGLGKTVLFVGSLLSVFGLIFMPLALSNSTVLNVIGWAIMIGFAWVAYKMYDKHSR